MLFHVNARTEWPKARKEMDFRTNIEQAEDDKKKDAHPVEPFRHAVSLTSFDFLERNGSIHLTGDSGNRWWRGR